MPVKRSGEVYATVEVQSGLARPQLRIVGRPAPSARERPGFGVWIELK